MSDDYSKYILDCINKIKQKRPVKIASSGKIAKIQCPNPKHKGGKEGDPSLIVNIVKRGKFQPGAAKCHACGIFFPNWKKVAQAIERPDLISDTAIAEYEESISNFYNEEIEQNLLGEDDVYLEDLEDAIPWNENEEWRGVNGLLLKQIEAKFYFDSELDKPMVYLPCMVNGTQVGGVRANLEKRGKVNYINTPGEWVKDLGLFPYDYVVKMLERRELDTIVLVEGSRDALRSIQVGIPALAILGTHNWSDVKANLVLSLHIKRVISAFDPDEAGNRAKALIYKSLKDDIIVKNFDFKKQMEKYKIQKDIDPGNAPAPIMKNLKHFVTAQW